MTFEDELEAERLWARKEGREEGRAEGRAEGRDAVADENARLARALQAAGREGELVGAMVDPATRERLLAEFGIAAG